jgi:hypothetical protein
MTKGESGAHLGSRYLGMDGAASYPRFFITLGGPKAHQQRDGMTKLKASIHSAFVSGVRSFLSGFRSAFISSPMGR